MLRWLFYIPFLFICSVSSGQTNVDSLVQRLQNYTFKNWDSVAYYANKILTGTNENQPLERGLAYQYLGVAQFEQSGNYDSAVALYDQSLPYFEQVGDSIKLATLYNNYGVVAKVRADYENALTYFYQANDLLENDTISNLHTTVLNNIGDVLIFIGKPDEAEKYLQLSYNLSLAKKDSLKTAQILATIGNLNNSRQAFDEAIKYYKKALAFQHSFATDSSFLIMNIGVVHHFKGELSKAIDYYQKAIEVAHAFNSPRNEALCYLNIGEAMITLNKPGAVANLTKAIALGEANNLKRVLRNGHQLLATYYQQVNSNKQALSQYKLFKKYNDAIINENALNKLNALNVKFNTAQKEKQIAKQALEIERQQASVIRERNQKIGVALGLGFLLLVAGFFYLRARMKQKAKLQQAIIQEKEKGLKAVFVATENERQRISKDLHDGIGQQLSGVKMQLESLDVKEEAIKRQKQQIADNLVQAAQEVRQISHQLMPRALEEEGLVQALEDLFEKTFNGTSINCSFEHHNTAQRFPKEIELSLYRITQELMNNIIKHANASNILVQLYKIKNKLMMTVEDDGIGFDIASAKDGHGLLNIKSRIETVHGKVKYESSEKSETVITLSVPID